MFKILVVDDSVFSQKITCNLVKDILGEVEFFVASDGREGLEKYKELHPDYVFMDLLMPVIDGKELTRLIKEYDSNAKIFVISADVQINVREEMEQLNVLSFINKPLNREKAIALCDMIRKDAYEQ